MVNIKSSKKILLYLAFVLAFSSTVQAHLIAGMGIESGISHPFSGFDHLLAMIAVGIISTRYGGKAVWMIPAIFVASMVAGGIMSISGLQISFAEAGIAFSVVFLGIAAFLQKKIPVYITMIFVALSAILHGHAHGSEMPLMASPLLYSAGFILSTAFLHISGVLLGHYAKKSRISSMLLRYSGAGIGFAGILFLTSAI